VYGDSLKDVLVAVIVPDVEVIKQQPQWSAADMTSLCANPAFIAVGQLSFVALQVVRDVTHECRLWPRNWRRGPLQANSSPLRR
jgi:hypothetical protein